MCYDGCDRIHPLLDALFQLLSFVIFLLKVFQEIHPYIGASCFIGISLISPTTAWRYLIECDTHFASDYKGKSPLIFNVIPLNDLVHDTIS